MSRGTIRLVVLSPDRRRVLGRPNGLAGWALPAVAVELPFTEWGEHHQEAAGRVVGGDVRPLTALGDDGWVVEATGRVSSAGAAWIAEAELDRLGADAGLARRAFVRADDERP